MAKRKSTEDSPRPTFPDSFVVVLAYDATEEDTAEEFAEMVEGVKALFSLRTGHRVYGLFDEAAKNVLALVEKPVENE